MINSARMTKLVTFLHAFVHFLIFPILTGYTLQLKNSTPEMIGLSLGVFGLTAAIITIPGAKLAKKVGAKTELIIGLTIFAFGSYLAFAADTIEAFTVARAVQGFGCVAGLLALVSDSGMAVTNVIANSTKLNVTAFFVAMLFAMPFFIVLNGPSVFLFIGATAVFSIILVLMSCVNTDLQSFDSTNITRVLKNNHVVRVLIQSVLAFTIFSGAFVVIPINITLFGALPALFQPVLYAIAIIVTLLLFIIDAFILKRFNVSKFMLVFAVLLVVFAMLLSAQMTRGAQPILITLILLFSGFLLAEIVNSKALFVHVDQTSIQAARLVNLVAQFLGVFIGGSVTGIVYSNFGTAGVFYYLFFIALIWLVVALKTPKLQATP